MDLDDVIAEGQRLLSQTKFEEAAVAFTTALAGAPDNPVLLASRGAAFIALGRHDEAFADFDRAVALAPDNPRLHYRRGMGRMAQMDFEAAVADFTRAIDLDHQYAVAFYSRGMAYDSLGREEESREDLRRSWVLGQARLQGELEAYGIIRTDMDKPR
ncbi:MAG TPA: tetratricopeptide repeat protein [Candidatus Methanoperedens sp.]|nr:tetratricopeptide repeat protein [Candidatus Methanoperedens sp.]